MGRHSTRTARGHGLIGLRVLLVLFQIPVDLQSFMRCWCGDPVQSQGGDWKMRSCCDVIPAFSFQCSAFDGACPLSCQDDVLNCFLIDNNGFILVSKRPPEIGKFLGAVDGSVMTQLLNMGMFRRVTMYDYQAMCKVPYHHHSGARPLLSPIYAFLAALKWLISDFLIFLLEFNMSSFWHSDNVADAKAVFHHSHKHKKHDTLQPCDTEYPVFVYEPTIKETNGLIECGDCQKMFVAQQIASSNLLLLVTDATCDCSIFPPVLLDAKEVKYNASVKCDRMRSQKLRRRPDTCHAFHPEENAQDCGGAAELSVSPMLLLLPPALLMR
uniref:Voltage-dependent calcium channel alpha-2/delta subunit conserved region domain-containing protein n=1 Tax=Meleagris gallopavo TaxID=9103 RepID=G3UP14_MELGA